MYTLTGLNAVTHAVYTYVTKAVGVHVAGYNFAQGQEPAEATSVKKNDNLMKNSWQGVLISCELLPYCKMTRVSVSLPKELVDIIDSERGDVPRSRYIMRLIQHKKGDDL